jgi:hypothetical protein
MDTTTDAQALRLDPPPDRQALRERGRVIPRGNGTHSAWTKPAYGVLVYWTDEGQTW